MSERFANMFIHIDPARCRCARAATFGAVLDVDLAPVFSLKPQAWKISQDGLAQTHASGTRQLRNGRGTGMLFAECVDYACHLITILTLWSFYAHSGAMQS
ncbi:hypothetical protein D3C84_907940 [compost metagenome]